MQAIRKIWSFISIILVIAVVLLAIALVGVRLFGLTPYTVLSGSMEPTYHVGSLIYVKDIEADRIEAGMPITFVVNEDLVVATHRVVNVERIDTKQQEILDEAGNPVLDQDGNPTYEEVALDEPSFYFTTKGDANDAEDGSQVYYKNVIGTPVFTLPYLGYLSNYIQNPPGTYIALAGGALLLLLMFLPDLFDDKSKKAKKRASAGAQPEDERNPQ